MVQVPQELVLFRLSGNILSWKTGVLWWSVSIARKTGWWWLGCTQKVQMVKCTPHRPYLSTYFKCFVNYINSRYLSNYLILIQYSKSVYDHKEKNNLLSCNMDTYNTRKVLCEKVQVYATLIGCNLWISQGRMCKKKIYNALW